MLQDYKNYGSERVHLSFGEMILVFEMLHSNSNRPSISHQGALCALLLPAPRSLRSPFSRLSEFAHPRADDPLWYTTTRSKLHCHYLLLPAHALLTIVQHFPLLTLPGIARGLLLRPLSRFLAFIKVFFPCTSWESPS